MGKHKDSAPPADELPAAPPAEGAAKETNPATAVDSTATQSSPAAAGTAAEEPAPPAAPRTARYHFEDGNGLHAVPCEAIPDEGGTYTIVRDGVPVVTGAPASDEPLSGHVIL